MFKLPVPSTIMSPFDVSTVNLSKLVSPDISTFVSISTPLFVSICKGSSPVMYVLPVVVSMVVLFNFVCLSTCKPLVDVTNKRSPPDTCKSPSSVLIVVLSSVVAPLTSKFFDIVNPPSVVTSTFPEPSTRRLWLVVSI